MKRSVFCRRFNARGLFVKIIYVNSMNVMEKQQNGFVPFGFFAGTDRCDNMLKIEKQNKRASGCQHRNEKEDSLAARSLLVQNIIHFRCSRSLFIYIHLSRFIIAKIKTGLWTFFVISNLFFLPFLSTLPSPPRQGMRRETSEQYLRRDFFFSP